MRCLTYIFVHHLFYLIRNRSLNVSTAILLSITHSGEKSVSHGASSRDAQAARATSQQQQQDDARETFRPSSVTSGKFLLNLNSFLRALYTFLSRVITTMLTRDIDIAILSVRPSVTFRYCVSYHHTFFRCLFSVSVTRWTRST